jgi:CCR4-NOT transcriptional regulation complex NOT5 subunit
VTCDLSFNRDWRYHKEERVWITRAPGMEPTLKTNAYERGTYYFFDCLNWRKVAKVKDRGLTTVTVVTVHSESVQTP